MPMRRARISTSIPLKSPKADWFSRDSVRAALDDVDPTTGLKMPPSFAIAHQLARGWVDGNS